MQHANQNAPLMSPKEAAAVTSLSRTYLSMMAANGDFPKPVQLTGQRRIAFVRDEVHAWIQERIAARSAA
jgi:prophage regulatory protein